MLGGEPKAWLLRWELAGSPEVTASQAPRTLFARLLLPQSPSVAPHKAEAGEERGRAAAEGKVVLQHLSSGHCLRLGLGEGKAWRQGQVHAHKTRTLGGLLGMLHVHLQHEVRGDFKDLWISTIGLQDQR